MTLVVDHLIERGVRFEVLPHRPATTALEEAHALGVPADEVVKVVVLDTETGHALALLPSYRRIDLHLVREALEDHTARLATEDELRRDFSEFELGAMPALPSLLHLPVVVDPEVVQRDRIVFAAGERRESVRVAPNDLLTGATVTVAPISRSSDEYGDERYRWG